MQNAINKLKTMNSKEDFVAFVELLLEDLKNNSKAWENNTLERYLEAIAGWTEGMDQYYINTHQPVPENVDWKVFANILIAATMQE